MFFKLLLQADISLVMRVFVHNIFGYVGKQLVKAFQSASTTERPIDVVGSVKEHEGMSVNQNISSHALVSNRHCPDSYSIKMIDYFQ